MATVIEILHEFAINLSKLDILKDLDLQKGQMDSLRPISKDAESRLMEKLRLEWNYHSNAIEGNSLSLGETRMFLMYGLTSKGKPFKDYLDIKGHNEVIGYLFDILHRSELITEAAIRELHKVLLVEPYEVKAMTPDGKSTSKTVRIGQYKHEPNHVKTITGKMHHYASPTETPGRMRDLMAWLTMEDERREAHPLVLATLFHHEFTSIHPFDDGNGRMARIMTNLILMRSGYLPLVVEKDMKDEYLYCLAYADEGDPTDLVRFLARREMAAISIFVRAANGEDIDELADFDKRLSLLKQKIETEATSLKLHRSPEVQMKVFEGVFLPILRMLLPRFADIDSLFSRNSTFVAIDHGGGKPLLFRDGERHDKLQGLSSQMAAHDVSQIRFHVSWEGFRKKPAEHLYCQLSFHFGHDSYSASFKRLQFERTYDEVATQEEIEEFASAILTNLYKDLDALSRIPY